VVSCPCALSLAVPAALTTVHGALAKLGVLALRPQALPALARADRIVFDKTGTLSDRRPRIAEVDIFDLEMLDGERSEDERLSRARALAIARALERDSGHPLAAAFETAAASPLLSALSSADDFAQAEHEAIKPEAVRSVPGHGVAGRIDGVEYRLGRAGWAVREAACGDGHMRDDDAVWLGDGHRAFARFGIEETPRGDARETVRALRELGLQVEICSGDAPARASSLARVLGIGDEATQARCTPEDKLAHVRARQAAGEVVAMVGDGLNDAPVLAGADVSLALADGAALAQRAADFVILGDALSKIPLAVTLARRAGRVIRENLAWAIGYNLCALPLAASGLVTPWMAAVGMALSSLLVTLNALRLARVPVPLPARAMDRARTAEAAVP
jgi:P-type Cu2+ transporter